MIDEAVKILKRDQIIKEILHLPLNIPQYDGDVNAYLYSSIISQQLSVKAADAIYNRFLQIFDFQSPAPELLLETPAEILKTSGISNSKIKYLCNVATFFKENKFSEDSWIQMSDEYIIKLLTSIKGVGVWTVEMVLIFCLARRDVFPVGDLGVRNAIIDLYHLEAEGKRLLADLNKIAEPWKPYRSIASLYLWSWRNNKS